MPRVTVGTENSAPIEIHYEDHGSGDPDRADPRIPAGRQRGGAPGACATRSRATASSATTGAGSAAPASRRSATTTTPSPPT